MKHAIRATLIVFRLTGLVQLTLGVTQAQFLRGDGHWVIRLLHLLTGLAAMGIGNALSARAGVAPRRWRPRRPVVVGWPEGGGL